TYTPTRTPTHTPTPTPTRTLPSIVVLKLDLETWTPRAGWRMHLYAGPDCRGPILATQTTDAEGLVDFVNLTPGVYSVAEELQPGYEPFTPICQTVELRADETVRTAAYPPAGDDTFPSGAGLLVQIGDQPTPVLLTLNGPTTVRRGDSGDQDGDGRADIPTEILSMNLTGSSPWGPVRLRESPTRTSRGLIEEQTPGAGFPADSFFDVFTELETPLGLLQHTESVRMEAVIGAIPPILAVYRSPDPLQVPLRNVQGQVVGFIRRAVHVPLPPKQIILIFINSPRPTPTPTVTPTPTPRVPVLTGISSVFTVSPNNTVDITIHALRDEYRNLIYDVDILFAGQNPPWQGVAGVGCPPGWTAEPLTVGGVVVGVRCVTEQVPLQVCQPTHFVFQLVPPEPPWPGQFITILLTDREHKVIGQITSQRVNPLTTPQRLARLLDPTDACTP
ncbi:MAG: hypothetical protein N2383_02890, partial [Caldilineales bacterium]|nr:hypothetical protein [Caldilineales bacterium]